MRVLANTGNVLNVKLFEMGIQIRMAKRTKC